MLSHSGGQMPGAPARVAHPNKATADHPIATPPIEDVQEAVQQLNEIVKPWATRLRFEIDDDTRQVVVQVIDNDTGDVLRQIPAEVALQMAKSLERLDSLSFHAQA